MADSLDLIRAKLGRAEELIRDLHNLPPKLPNGPFYGVMTEFDRESGLITFRATDVENFPPLYPLIIGEIAHHLRSTLDHIAFAISNPAPGQEQRVKFPLCSSRKEFKKRKGALIRPARGVITRVERVQPYHRRKWPDTQLLGQLQAISNWDKHRTLAVAAFRAESAKVGLARPRPLEIVAEEYFRGTIKNNKIIARFQVMPNVPDEIELHPYVEVVITPIFDKGGPKEVAGKNVIVTLEYTRTFILNEVLPLFEPFFQ